MPCIENLYITAPGEQGDGLTLCDGQHYVIRNCIIDFSEQNLEDIDEAIGITWGCSAEVHNCVFRGAGKLVLCGSGDRDRLADERGRHVIFRNCLFENFSRRGPEVQDGMRVELHNCVIRNWGLPARFSVRAFGAWAHGDDSQLFANNCVFMQGNLFTRDFVKDFVGHAGQAVNDGGLCKLFSREAWLPGRCRGLTASAGGYVKAWRCYANHKWIILDNRLQNMDESEAMELVTKLEAMKASLLEMYAVSRSSQRA